MEHKKNNKRYIYTRHNGICYFCGKKLLFRQVSLDHYFPKSKGGPDDIFNLVCSCKRCNKYKKSFIPNDYKEVMMDLFKKAVKDGKVTTAAIKINKKDLNYLINEIFKIEEIGKYTVFQSNTHRFYVKDNRIYKIVKVDTAKIEDEGW
ncbi:HNH endonuclease [Paramaledivibacter caminithermalis]|jgi:CRISPR/Cas system Type II protein with McrA/HNH and RuvC-like nuclease domain|uniref:HNH endonuclease n=1 Tax=Paramaledivibacter caminithermalis (strain DSM 15212 / CIP 107654 / DViRD3) TaxID=1121301 RepID=A0A1M6NBR0_PARC5|nr:HNH endonuclease [Paramaledivibacter caminithermalis]SHJ93113.1 HNH endonuclease [Paramaledivibacter caminithermalis DSM 15212]